ANTASSLAGCGETKFRNFIKRFFELVWQAPGLLKVREFESVLAYLISDGPVSDEQNLPFAIVSISHDGAISTFSPELLGARHPGSATLPFGTVATIPLADIAHAGGFQPIRGEIGRGVDAGERSCRYFRWCGGGAPANKLFETGQFDATETMHCRLTR